MADKPDDPALFATTVASGDSPASTTQASFEPLGLAATGHSGDHSIVLPAVIGRFEIVEKLGAGGMGVVMLATDPRLGRRIALKVLHRNREESPAARARFVREAQAMAQLSHDNVIVVHEVGTHDEQVYLAMEYIAGTTLTRWQVGRAWREILAVYLKAGRGLEAAHAAGLVHRDFKPDNVLIGNDGKVRVTDFGLVATTNDRELAPKATTLPENPGLASSLTETGTLMGTPRYMSPEQHRGEPVDARADQFAFCVALYEALHGQPPFVGDTYRELADNVLSGQFRRAEDDNIPSPIDAALLRGLSIDREGRFRSMGELLAALELPAQPHIVTPPRRPRILWLVLGAAVICAGIAIYSAIAARDEAEQERQKTRQAQEVADKLAVQLLGFKGTETGTEFHPESGKKSGLESATTDVLTKMFDVAQDHFNAARYDEAAKGFLAVYDADGNHRPQFLYNAAAAYQMKARRSSDPAAYVKALELYRRYVSTDPSDRTKVEGMIRALEKERANR